jgi:hypothetical protein
MGLDRTVPSFYGYSSSLLGSQTTAGVGGAPIDYRTTLSGNWAYSGDDTYFVVQEAQANNRNFDGDPDNEQIDPRLQIGGSRAQTVSIDGVDRQVIWDYTFTVSLGNQTWRIGVIDVDLDNSDVIDPGEENGYFLVFPDGMPPPDTNLTIGPVIENDARTSHEGLGGTVVCFAAGTQIETATGPRAIETLTPGDMVLTRDDGLQPLRWIGMTRVPARDELAPVVIGKGVLGNTSDLILSPQHAVLLSDWRAQLLYGADDVLVRAIDLLGQPGVTRLSGGFVTYCHILFDAHHLVQTSGVWSESLYPGDMTLQTVNPAAKAEIEALFPDLDAFGPKSARCLRHYEARCLAA